MQLLYTHSEILDSQDLLSAWEAKSPNSQAGRSPALQGPSPTPNPWPHGAGAPSCSWLLSHLLEQCVVGAIQVEFPQVVPVGKDEEGLFICTGKP